MSRVHIRYALILSGWLALAASALPAWLMPVRVAVMAGFLLACPGAAALQLTHPAHRGRAPGRLEFAVLSVAFSITIDTLVAEAFYFSRSVTTARAIGALAVLTSLMALYPVRSLRSRPGGAVGDGVREPELES